MMDHYAQLSGKQIRAVRRDMNTDEDSQRKRNTDLTIARLRNWLYERGVDCRTGLPVGKPKNKKVA